MKGKGVSQNNEDKHLDEKQETICAILLGNLFCTYISISGSSKNSDSNDSQHLLRIYARGADYYKCFSHSDPLNVHFDPGKETKTSCPRATERT